MPEPDPHVTRLKLPAIVKGAGVLFAGGAASKVLGYAFNILAAKMVGLKVYGLYTLSLSILRTVGFGLPKGHASPTIRYVSMYHAKGDAARVKGTIRLALKTTALFSVLSLAAFYLFSGYLALHIFHQPKLADALSYLAISIPFARLSSVFLSATLAMQLMVFRTMTKDLLEPAVRLVVFLILALQGLGLQALVFAYLASAILGSALAYYFFAKTFAHLFSSPFFRRPEAKTIKPISESKTIFKFTLPLVIARTFGQLRRQGDILCLGFFLSPRQVGLYTILYKTVNALNEITDSLLEVFSPMIPASLEKGAISKLRSQLQIVSRWIFSLLLPVTLFALFHARPVLSVLGDQFTGGETAFIILLIGFLFEMTTAPTGRAVTMSGRSHVTLANTIALGVLNLALLLILIPRYGIEGAGLAVSVTMVLLSILRVIECRSIVGIQPFTTSYLKPLLAAGVCLAITLLIDHLLPGNKYLFLGCSFGVFLTGYLAVLVLIGLDPAERFILAKVKARLLP